MVTDEDAARRRIVEEFIRCTDVFSTGTFKLNRLRQDIARNSFVRANIERWPS